MVFASNCLLENSDMSIKPFKTEPINIDARIDEKKNFRKNLGLFLETLLEIRLIKTKVLIK